MYAVGLRIRSISFLAYFESVKMKLSPYSVLLSLFGSDVYASAINRQATTSCAEVGIAAKAWKVNHPGCTTPFSLIPNLPPKSIITTH